MEKAQDKKDEGLAGLAEGDRGSFGRGWDLEGAVAEAAAEIEASFGGQAAEEGGDAVGKGSGPDGVQGEYTCEDGRGRLGRTEGAGGEKGRGGTAEPADGGGLEAGIGDPLGGEGLLDLEDGVDALGGDVGAGVVVKEQGGIEVVVDGDVDLAAAGAVGVDNEGAGGAVALGQVVVEEVEPVLLGGGAAGGGMLKDLAGREIGEHLALEVEKDLMEVDATAVGVFAHRGWWERPSLIPG